MSLTAHLTLFIVHTRSAGDFSLNDPFVKNLKWRALKLRVLLHLLFADQLTPRQ